VNRIMLTLTHSGTLIVLAMLVGSVTYAEPNVGVCDDLQGTPKGLYGLCVAFCEAQDCVATVDETTGELSFPKNCGPSSEKTLAKYNSRLEPGDPAMPCVNVEAGGCPCWNEAEIDLVADELVTSCQDSPTLSLLWGRDATTGNLDYAGIQVETNITCYYQEMTPTFVRRYQVIDAAQHTACRNSVTSECTNRGFPLP
jgi:hypothetical protein